MSDPIIKNNTRKKIIEILALMVTSLANQKLIYKASETLKKEYI